MRLEELTLVQAAEEIRQGRLSSVDYVRGLLRRIEKLEPLVRAWVTIDPARALKDAAECDTETRDGRFRGRLHGVPIGVKDIFQTKDLRTTAGSRFLQDFVPSADADAVAQLRRAGAIVLGKTVTTEFATFDPGPTRNPWNPEHTPGGSSSGSASAVAARMCAGATGSQTVGSIGRPAAYCGVVGFMPTRKRVSGTGVFPVSWSLDHIGGFVRSVSDAHLMLEVLSGQTIGLALPDRPIRAGVVQSFFESSSTPETRGLHHALLRKLSGPNFSIEQAELPPIFEIHSPILMTIMRAEAASAHVEFYQDNSDLYGKKLRALVETGMLVDSSSYLRALRLRKIYQREMARLFENFDILISPGAMDTAPEGLGGTGNPAFSAPWTLADFPTLSLPSGVASNGMPVGIQISAAPMQEGLLFGVGQVIEETIEFNDSPHWQIEE